MKHDELIHLVIEVPNTHCMTGRSDMICPGPINTFNSADSCIYNCNVALVLYSYFNRKNQITELLMKQEKQTQDSQDSKIAIERVYSVTRP